MQLLDTKHKRKSATITSVIVAVLLLLMFKSGMKYLDPPPEYGVAINFGDSNFGSGEPIKNAQTPAENETEIEESSEEQPQETSQEKVISDETSQEIAVSDNKKVDTKKTASQDVKEVPKITKPKPSKATTDALNSLLKGNPTNGEGDDSKKGVKGSKDGDPNASKYYGGGGSGGNYRLAGRKALSKPIKKPNCQEEGSVVVSIYVDKSGKVTKAIPGSRGTTNSAPCLFKAAKEAALNTKWNPDSNAPSTQKGTIIYRFSLSQ